MECEVLRKRVFEIEATFISLLCRKIHFAQNQVDLVVCLLQFAFAFRKGFKQNLQFLLCLIWKAVRSLTSILTEKHHRLKLLCPRRDHRIEVNFADSAILVFIIPPWKKHELISANISDVCSSKNFSKVKRFLHAINFVQEEILAKVFKIKIFTEGEIYLTILNICIYSNQVTERIN